MQNLFQRMKPIQEFLHQASAVPQQGIMPIETLQKCRVKLFLNAGPVLAVRDIFMFGFGCLFLLYFHLKRELNCSWTIILHQALLAIASRQSSLGNSKLPSDASEQPRFLFLDLWIWSQSTGIPECNWYSCPWSIWKQILLRYSWRA